MIKNAPTCDLSILDYLIGRMPTRVAATGMAHLPGRPVNIAYLSCFYADDMIAHLHVNWLAPVKVRRTMICGSERMVLYDDIEASEKVKVYDKGIILGERDDLLVERHIGYRTGDVWAPRLDSTEALAAVAAHFVDCITTGSTPRSDGHAGLRVVRILEAASRSLDNDGVSVDLCSSP